MVASDELIELALTTAEWFDVVVRNARPPFRPSRAAVIVNSMADCLAEIHATDCWREALQENAGGPQGLLAEKMRHYATHVQSGDLKAAIRVATDDAPLLREVAVDAGANWESQSGGPRCRRSDLRAAVQRVVSALDALEQAIAEGPDVAEPARDLQLQCKRALQLGTPADFEAYDLRLTLGRIKWAMLAGLVNDDKLWKQLQLEDLRTILQSSLQQLSEPSGSGASSSRADESSNWRFRPQE